MAAAPTLYMPRWAGRRCASASSIISSWTSHPARAGDPIGSAPAGCQLRWRSFCPPWPAAAPNVLISGPTGAGKSTLLRSLVSAFPPEERVITIEDTAELELDTPHWVKLECVHSKSLGEHGSGARRLDVGALVQHGLGVEP